MKFLANENFPFPGIHTLRKAGFYVKSISEDCPGITDEEVMGVAVEEDLIILTFDSDYGELIFKYALTNPPSVVFFQEKGRSVTDCAMTLLKLIHEDGLVLINYFTVIDNETVRQRSY